MKGLQTCSPFLYLKKVGLKEEIRMKTCYTKKGIPKQYCMGVGELTKLSIREILRAANHDFINQLQLIKMNLDLDRIDDAKKIIENYCNQYKSFSNLNKLNWPKTVEWIQTFPYRFPSIEFLLKSNVTMTPKVKKDEETVEYLEKTIQRVYPHLDPYTEQQLLMEVEADEEIVKITFDLHGKWDVEPFHSEILDNHVGMSVEKESFDHWKYVLTIKE